MNILEINETRPKTEKIDPNNKPKERREKSNLTVIKMWLEVEIWDRRHTSFYMVVYIHRHGIASV